MLNSNGVKKDPQESYLLEHGKHVKNKSNFQIRLLCYIIFGNQRSPGVAQDPEGRMN